MTNPLTWQKSSRCATNACVEVAFSGDMVLVRDSKSPNLEPLTFTIAEWVAFRRGVLAGEFD